LEVLRVARSLRSLSIAAFFSAAAAFAVSYGPASASSGLTAAQRSKLARVSIPVVAPQDAPAGFSVRQVYVNGDSYSIQYVRSRDGATITFHGQRGKPRRKHRGFFDSVGRMFRGGSSDDTASQGEQEQRMTGVIVDSDVVGPAELNPDGRGCASGNADTSKGSLRAPDFGFSVNVCNLHQRDVDMLTRVYRSLNPLPK
jgi:hypothetical protein